MTISADDIAKILIAGERDRKAVAQISEAYGDPNNTTAYADSGRSCSPNSMPASTSPLYRVTASMLSTYGAPIPFDRFIHPRVESEIAFMLGMDIRAPATVTSVLTATELVYGAVDVLDSRYPGIQVHPGRRCRRQRQRRSLLPGTNRQAPGGARVAPARLRRSGRRAGRDDCRRRGSDGTSGGLVGHPTRGGG